MKRKRKIRINFKRLLATLFIVGIIIFLFFNNKPSNSNQSSINITAKYENENYSGTGRQTVTDKDGYSTTFTTFTGKTYKEFKQNGNSSWSNNAYWDSVMSYEGCGITSMSIILSGYNMNYTPEDLRVKYYPVLSGDNIPSELSNTFGIPNSNFYYDSEHMSNDYIIEHLKNDTPILVCVWDKPCDNRWTTASHFMVLLACDDYNMVYVSNPNGLDDTSKASGWYDINEITPYIAKILYLN